MKRFVVFTCATFMMVCAGLSPLHAQEAVVAQPASGNVCPGVAALEAKVSDLTRLVAIMETQINKCAAQQGITCPSELMKFRSCLAADERRDHGDSQREVTVMKGATANGDEDRETVSSNVVPPPPAPTRYGGGFRMAPEQRLTCDDYSTSYFERHPTMAKVCGREVQGEPEQTIVMPQEMVSATLVSGTQGL